MGNIGVGHAATGLASLLGKRIDVTSPQVHCLTLSKVVESLGGAERMVCAILLKITGEFSGSIMLVFPEDSSLQLLRLWFGEDESITMPLSDFYESALKELGNIATGAYLTALNKLTGHAFSCSAPLIATDMLGSLLDEVLCDSAVREDSVVLIDTGFVLDQQAIQGFIVLIVTPTDMEKIFSGFDIT